MTDTVCFYDDVGPVPHYYLVMYRLAWPWGLLLPRTIRCLSCAKKKPR